MDKSEQNESIRTVSVMMKTFGITSKEAFAILAKGQQLGVYTPINNE
ncbi:hypothetical protein J1P26_22685 [Neobacillus sp. MM2021_6]|nr:MULTISPECIES: hypothetical protein [Bacillaceae]MBO0962505.1 hypothetical protein [Neobacillus sp. MM2021_6]NHC21294.1 hypothetical protein [Bacillus sp. MM2020_4]